MNINKTLDSFLIENNPLENKELNDSLLDFLRGSISEKQSLAQNLVKELVKQHRKEELVTHITELYEVESATMSLTGKRDHVVHAINTFILGLYINNKFLNDEVDLFQWKLASLFHDVAYPLEISQQIIERYLKKLSEIKDGLHIENFNPALKLVPKNFEKLTNNKTSFEYIQKRIYKWGLDVNVQKRYLDMISSNKMCHGIMSALTVLYLIDLMYQKKNPKRDNDSHTGWKQKNFEMKIVSACSAIFLHNLSDDAFENINKHKAPLAYLLKLSDELQDWNRPNTKNSNGDSSKNYDIKVSNRKLIFKVNDDKLKDKIFKNIKCLNDTSIEVIINE